MLSTRAQETGKGAAWRKNVAWTVNEQRKLEANEDDVTEGDGQSWEMEQELEGINLQQGAFSSSYGVH